jgi:hypothetical protein
MPVTKLVELPRLLRLHLVGCIAGGVALDAGRCLKIRSAEQLLAVLIDYFEIEISGQRQSLRVAGSDCAITRRILRVAGLTRTGGRQNRRQQRQCTHAGYTLDFGAPAASEIHISRSCAFVSARLPQSTQQVGHTIAE